jgi:DNA-binding MarR family transcriptional regulator
LKLPEWRVIALLASHHRLTAARIEELTGSDRGLLSRTVHALNVRGLVVAERSRTDRREVHLTLTPPGRQLYRQQLPLMQARQAHLLAALSAQEQRLVYQIVDKLLIAAEAREFGEQDR